MKHKETTCLIAIVVLFLMSFGCVSAVATGLALTVDYGFLALGCLMLSMIAAVLYSIPKGGRIAITVGLLTLGLLAFNRSFQEQVLSLCQKAVECYSLGYGFEMPEVLQMVEPAPHILPLLVVAGIINVVGAWTILHRYPAALTVFVAVFPLVSCFVVTDTVPHIWALALWIMGLGLLVMTQTVRIRSHSSGNRLTAILSVPLLLGLTLMFLLIPKENYSPPFSFSDFQDTLGWVIDGIPFVGQTSDGKLVLNFGSDLDNRVDLSSMDDRKPGTSTVLEVTASHSETIYLRLRDYDVYNGKGWRSTERYEVFAPPSGELTGTERTLDIRVLGNRTQLLVPYYPRSELELESGLAPTKTSNREYRYEVLSLRYNWDTLWRNSYYPTDTTVDPLYLELPESTTQAAQGVLENIWGLAGCDTVQAAQRIGSYVCKTAVYSLEVDQMPADADFAIWFMESADRGFCVHFATAATVLLRAHGIPARYVEGYSFEGIAHERVEVTQDMAHAWVEYYVPNVGWVILDPTPGFGGVEEYTEPTTPNTEPSRPNHTEPSKPSEPEPSVPVEKPTETTPSEPATTPSTSKPTQTKPSESSGTGTTASQGGEAVNSTQKEEQPTPREPMPQWLVNILIGLAATAGTLLVLLGQWVLRRWWKLRRLSSGSNARRLIARYGETCRICRAMKKPVPEELTALAEKAGFSQHAITKEELETVGGIFRSHFQSLQNGKWYQKLYWRFILALY